MTESQYIERDVSWLSFNERVLQEARDPSVPLYERLKFLAIFSSNLDEFFRVRVSSMRSFKKMKKKVRKTLDIKPKRILKRIHAIVNAQQAEFGRIFTQEILPELAKHGIHLVSEDAFNTEQRAFAATYFKDKLAPLVTPHRIGEGAEAVFLQNRALYLVVQHDAEAEKLTVLPIPADEAGRFVELPATKESYAITFVDDIIRASVPEILPGENIVGVYAIKLSRDAELYLGDEFRGDLIKRREKSLAKRQTGLPTRFLYDQTMPDYVRDKLKRIFDLSKDDLIPGARYHNFNDFFTFPDPTRSADLHDPELPPLPHPAFETESIIDAIETRDLMLHFPYQKYDYVPALIREAADHPEVTHIKITLYRVASKSAVAIALLDALAKGKQVTVFIEAKARFDEESNLNWGKQLKAAGGSVLYSYPGIKVHSKLLSVTFADGDDQRFITYLGTGNFNEKTARLYSDHALFTADPVLGKEVDRVFQTLQGKLIAPKCKELFVSPFSTRRKFVKLVDSEIKNARAGKEAWMILKMNSLEDHDMIDKLYEASQAGVRIRMIVRGICCAVPGVPGLSENLEVVSIVDRFLEHARIYVFANDGDPKLYLASADWMTRNLDRRVEVVFPIRQPDLFAQLMAIVNLQLSDNTKARIIDTEQTNPYKKAGAGEGPVRAQVDTYRMIEEAVTQLGV